MLAPLDWACLRMGCRMRSARCAVLPGHQAALHLPTGRALLIRVSAHIACARASTDDCCLAVCLAVSARFLFAAYSFLFAASYAAHKRGAAQQPDAPPTPPAPSRCTHSSSRRPRSSALPPRPTSCCSSRVTTAASRRPPSQRGDNNFPSWRCFSQQRPGAMGQQLGRWGSSRAASPCKVSR